MALGSFMPTFFSPIQILIVAKLSFYYDNAKEFEDELVKARFEI